MLALFIWRSVMILLQVHLRKPCYDSYFLWSSLTNFLASFRVSWIRQCPSGGLTKTIQLVVVTGGVYKGRDVINTSWWLMHTRNSSFKIKNYNDLQDYPHVSVKERLAAIVSVVCLRPRTSKGITDLLLPSWLWLNTNSPSKKSNTIRKCPDYLAGQGLVRWQN